MHAWCNDRAIKDIETRRQKIHAADPSYTFAVFSATRILFLPKLTQFIAENLPNSKTNLNSPCSRSFWLKLFPSLCSGDKICRTNHWKNDKVPIFSYCACANEFPDAGLSLWRHILQSICVGKVKNLVSELHSDHIEKDRRPRPKISILLKHDVLRHWLVLFLQFHEFVSIF